MAIKGNIQTKLASHLLLLLPVFLFLGVVSCAPKVKYPVSLDSERLNNVKRVAIHISQANPKIQIFDINTHSNALSKFLNEMKAGEKGMEVEGLMRGVMSEANIKKVFGKSFTDLQAYVDNREFDDLFKTKFAEVISARHTEGIEIVFIYEDIDLNMKDFKRSLSNQKNLLRKYSAELLVDIDYIYGIAVKNPDNSHAVVRASMNVIDLRDNSIVILRNLSSGHSNSGSKFKKYATGKSALFKSEYVEAVGKIANSVAEVLYLRSKADKK